MVCGFSLKVCYLLLSIFRFGRVAFAGRRVPANPRFFSIFSLRRGGHLAKGISSDINPTWYAICIRRYLPDGQVGFGRYATSSQCAPAQIMVYGFSLMVRYFGLSILGAGGSPCQFDTLPLFPYITLLFRYGAVVIC